MHGKMPQTLQLLVPFCDSGLQSPSHYLTYTPSERTQKSKELKSTVPKSRVSIFTNKQILQSGFQEFFLYTHGDIEIYIVSVLSRLFTFHSAARLFVLETKIFHTSNYSSFGKSQSQLNIFFPQRLGFFIKTQQLLLHGHIT